MTAHSDSPALSVVVMGYRNERTICSAVSSVLEQEHDAAIEVVVVTSGNDRSAELMRERHPDVRVVESAKRLLPGAARNAGLRATCGEAIAFLAADCRAEPGWVAARLAAHRAGHAAVAGVVLPEEPANALAWAGHYLLFPSRLPAARSEEIAYPDDRAHGLSYTRDSLERLGPFPENLRIGEDTEMARRLQELGIPVWLAADAVITHPAPRRVRQLVRDQYLRGKRTATFVGPPPPRRLSRTRATLGAIRGVWGRLRWSQQRVFALAPDHRRKLVEVGPWMVLGLLGHQAGWTRVRVAAIGAATERDNVGGEAPDDSPEADSPDPPREARANRWGDHVRSFADLRHTPYAPDDAVVALTFDDGPDPDFTPRIIEILSRFDARATFFMLGERAARHPDLVKQVASAGHAVESHTWGHVDLTQLDPGDMHEEIERTNDLLSRLSGRPVLGVRPPFAQFTPEIVAALGKRGLETVLWNVDSRDWQRPGPEAIVQNTVGSLGPGQVILMHDGGGDRTETIEALPEIIAQLRRSGYRAVPLYSC